MPASPGNPEQLGARPSGPITPETVAEWEARTYRNLGRYAPPAAGEPVLDDVVPELEELLADPDAGAAAIVDELAP